MSDKKELDMTYVRLVNEARELERRNAKAKEYSRRVLGNEWSMAIMTELFIMVMLLIVIQFTL